MSETHIMIIIIMLCLKFRFLSLEIVVFTEFCCCSYSPSRHGKSKDFMPGMSLEVTVGDLTVVITDYEPKSNHKRSSTDSQDSSSFHSNTDTGSPPLCGNRVPDWGALSDLTAGILYSALGRIAYEKENMLNRKNALSSAEYWALIVPRYCGVSEIGMELKLSNMSSVFSCFLFRANESCRRNCNSFIYDAFFQCRHR